MPRVSKARPHKRKKVISLREVRLSSVLGHTKLVPKQTPVEIPEPLFADALAKGCVDYNPRMLKAMTEMLENIKDEDEVRTTEVNPRELVKDAVKSVMLYGSEDALRRDSGAPKVGAVRAALDEEGITANISVTGDLVYDLFLELEDEGVETSESPEEVDNTIRDASAADDDLDIMSDTSDELDRELQLASASAVASAASEE